MGKSMFARGYDASREEKARQDKARENMGKRLWRFFLKDDGEEAEVRFLTEEPVNFWEHNIKKGSNQFEQYTCTGDDCPFCNDGDKPTYKGAYLIVDHREYEYKDKDSGKTKKGKDQVRLFVQGMKVVSQLDRISERYGLSNRDVTIVRLGNGTQTTYTIERGDEDKLSQKEVRNLLPEKLRDEYDGKVSSLMDIIEEQLMMRTKDYDPNNDDDEDEEEEDRKVRSRIIRDDDEEDEKPKKKKLTASGSSKKPKSLFRKAEDNRKPKLTAKSLLKKPNPADSFMNIPEDGIDDELPFN